MVGKDGSLIGPFKGELCPVRDVIDRTASVSYPLRMSLLRSIFWVALFLFFTFSFVVLFEYGTADFVPGFQKEFARVKTFVINQTTKTPQKKDKK
jgi:hypothetical protein